jgi:predicted HTH domain antitoxin
MVTVVLISVVWLLICRLLQTLRATMRGLVGMCQVTFTVPDELLAAMHATPEELAAHLRLAAAVKLYELGSLSSGAASQLADVPKPYFLSRLADFGVDTFEMSAEELENDIKNA